MSVRTAAGPPAGTGIDVHRAADRFTTRLDWLESHHSFSFGSHYDPDNTGFGLLLVNNEDVVSPGSGFDPHPHRDMEIVTWVLRGSLVHRDSAGHSGVVHPGLVQRQSAGRGIEHSERNEGEKPVHYVQMWVAPDETGLDPSYEQLEVGPALAAGGLVPVASGLPRHADAGALRIANRSAALHAARLDPGVTVRLPDAPFLHLFVPRGRVGLEGVGGLETGDAVRVAAEGGQRVEGLGDGTAELLVWEMHAPLS